MATRPTAVLLSAHLQGGAPPHTPNLDGGTAVLVGRHLLPTRHRTRFIVAFVVVRLLMLAAEFAIFGETPPAWVALLVTVAVYALFYLVGRRLGLYEPLPENVDQVGRASGVAE